MVLVVGLRRVCLFDPDQHDLHRDDPIIEREYLDPDCELLLGIDLRAKVYTILRSLLFDQGDHFLQVLEVDADREDRRLEVVRDQGAQVRLQRFFLVFQTIISQGKNRSEWALRQSF